MELHKLQNKDYPLVKSIYDYYVVNTSVTLRSDKITISELREMVKLGNVLYPSFLIKVRQHPVGFCFLSPYRNKPAYRLSAEVALYLKPEFVGKGLGRKTLEGMESIARDLEFHVLIATISGENDKSRLLFEKCGFFKCAHFKAVGEKFDRLHDVIAYQKIIKP